ncbi:MAG: hypothetical protein RML32_01040 [Gammaproteobacteria bacterium]|nr:hypothetical protein [Gammaproteobacteria bacterium]
MAGRAGGWLRRQSGWRRVALWCLAGALGGVVLVPWAIYAVGRLTLGAYANGGPFALWADFFRGLADGMLAYWIAALGPLCLVIVGLAWRKIRKA